MNIFLEPKSIVIIKISFYFYLKVLFYICFQNDIIKVLKTDLSLYMDADSEIQILQSRINYYEEIIFFLDKILRCLNDIVALIKIVW